jgi:hypothetical protein
MATTEDMLTARIVLRAVLPLIKVMVEDDPKKRAQFEGVSGTVQFSARDESGPIGAHIRFDNGAYSLVQELIDKPDVDFVFSSVAKMNAMFRGKPVLPSLGPLVQSAFRNFGLLVKTFGLLLGLKLLMPDAKPKTDELKRLKVKMTLYMISTALSQLNKFGDPEMVKWTTKQPERIYQWSVNGTDIACYLKIKAGQTKAGRGAYVRRQPFVHMKFAGVDEALPILGNEVPIVEAMTKGMVVNDGSPEYGSRVGDFMQRIGNLLV